MVINAGIISWTVVNWGGGGLPEYKIKINQLKTDKKKKYHETSKDAYEFKKAYQSTTWQRITMAISN
jgi:hypothetical protein